MKTILKFNTVIPTDEIVEGQGRTFKTLPRLNSCLLISKLQPNIKFTFNYHLSTFKKQYHFYIKSRKINEQIKKENKPAIILNKRIWDLKHLKFKDIHVSYPKNQVICFENLEQIGAVLYNKKVKPKEVKDTNKIIEQFNNKAGIYLIRNKINKKFYIGKSTNIHKRISNYCDPKFLFNHKESSNIYRAILKHKYNNFTFSILELCELNNLNEREQHFIDKLNPQYNIRKITHKNPTK